MGVALGGARVLALLAAVLLVVALASRRISPVPDLVLVLVVAWGLLRGPVAGAAAGLAGGWLLDLAPPGAGTLGVTALAYAAAGALAGRARTEGPVAAPRFALVALAAGALVEGVAALQAVAANTPVDLVDAGLCVLLSATVAGVVVPVIAGVERGLVQRRYG